MNTALQAFARCAVLGLLAALTSSLAVSTAVGPLAGAFTLA